MELFKAFLLQIVSTVGIIALFGLIIALLRRGFCALAPKNGPRILLATGIIGTPIHELSHALMCLIFGHRITEIKLYEPNSQNGALGHVTHSYNKRNIYHQIGNFFIGTAPVILGGVVIVLLMALIVPNSFDTLVFELRMLTHTSILSLPISDFFEYVWAVILTVFSPNALASWQGWLFILLAIMISTHMEMSGADIKGSLLGFLILAALLLLVDGMLFLIHPASLEVITGGAMRFGLVLSAFLSLSVLFLLVLLVLGSIFKLISLIFRG